MLNVPQTVFSPFEAHFWFTHGLMWQICCLGWCTVVCQCTRQGQWLEEMCSSHWAELGRGGLESPSENAKSKRIPCDHQLEELCTYFTSNCSRVVRNGGGLDIFTPSRQKLARGGQSLVRKSYFQRWGIVFPRVGNPISKGGGIIFPEEAALDCHLVGGALHGAVTLPNGIC